MAAEDFHVLIAAVMQECDVIVTENVGDFPFGRRMLILRPADFLRSLREGSLGPRILDRQREVSG